MRIDARHHWQGWAAGLMLAALLLALAGRPVRAEDLELPVPRVTVYPGEAIGEDQLVQRSFIAHTVARATVFDARAALLGKVARRTLLPGQPIPVSAIRDPYLVTNGKNALVVFEADGLTGIAGSASFSGQNWLSIDSTPATYNATKSIVSSFTRTGGAVSVGTIDINTSSMDLFDANAAATDAAAGNRQSPSASVIVRTEAAGDFSSAPAIRHLVSAAVPGMTLDQVTVLNTDGTVLASGGDSAGATPGKMVSLEKTIAKELQDNIAKTLTPYLGLSNFEISVATRLNTDKRQINETAYSPESRVERSVRVVKETGSSQNNNNRTTTGVEQNVPADQPSAASADQSRRTNDRREELTNYEVSTKTTSTVSEGYRIENLAIAVVVNRKRLLASLGENPSAEVVDKQLKEVERLVGSAAGVDLKRGDRITVAAVEFVNGDQTLEPAPAIGMVEHLLRNTSSIVNAAAMIAITALLVWFGVRPAMRAILEPRVAEAAQARELKAGAPPATDVTAAPKLAGETQPNLIADLTSKLGRTPQKRLEQMIDYDEAQAATILKQWMRGARSA